ncbi:hypothetical protein AKO1_010193, partial [Acrasis kona]
MMRVGYPCANRTQKLHTNHKFVMKSFSIEKIKEKVNLNLKDFKKMLEYNLKHDLLFFRIGSECIPFASHQLMRDLEKEMKFRWQDQFAQQLLEIGDFVREHGMRISMHPDHFCLINSPSDDILEKSIQELEYHADLFECMKLDSTHKFQIHVGGVYGDKQSAMERFVQRYKENLSQRIKKHLVIENDDHLFSLEDCMWIHNQCGVPILFDTLHHECLNHSQETQRQAFARAAATWVRDRDGIPMIDYSSQTDEMNAKRGKHTEHVDIEHFERIVCKQVMCVVDEKDGNYIPFDVMLEIKDKEKSAVECIVPFAKYRELYHGPQRFKLEFTEEEIQAEIDEIEKQARISKRDENGIKLEPVKGEPGARKRKVKDEGDEQSTEEVEESPKKRTRKVKKEVKDEESQEEAGPSPKKKTRRVKKEIVDESVEDEEEQTASSSTKSRSRKSQKSKVMEEPEEETADESSEDEVLMDTPKRVTRSASQKAKGDLDVVKNHHEVVKQED